MTEKTKRWRSIGGVFWELAKWGLVVYLLLPVRSPLPGKRDVIQVMLGILLFIIFAGKLLYDTIILSILRQKRDSVKKDIITVIGMVVVVALVVGLLLVTAGFLLMYMFQNMNNIEAE